MADEDWIARRLDEILSNKGVVIPRIDESILGEHANPDVKYSFGEDYPPRTSLEALVLDLRAYIENDSAIALEFLENVGAKTIQFEFDSGEVARHVSFDTIKQSSLILEDAKVIINKILEIVRGGD